MKIRILTQNPLSVWFGWIEQQALKYIEYMRVISPEIDIDFFKWDELNFDILHVIGVHSAINPYMIDVLKANGVKIIVSSVFYVSPNTLLDFRREWIYKLMSKIPFHVVNWMWNLLRKADLVLPNSVAEGEQITRIFGLENRYNVIFNWIDDNFFQGIDENEFKTRYNLESYLLCVSHLEPRKNHLNLIKAFLDSNFQWKLVLLGKYRWNYFSYHDEIKGLISSNPDRILHIDSLSNTDTSFRSAYLGASAHILPSILETPGLSNLEAWLCGTELIIWDCAPVREYFEEFAMYVSWTKIQEITQSINSITGHKNPMLSQHIKERFSWSRIARELNKFYTTK